MNFDFEQAGQSLTVGEIIAYEAGARIRLPPQYRTFLLQQNGCYPAGMIYSDTGFDADVSEIYPLFVVKKSPRTTVVSVTGDLIWFAGDSGGGQFGLAWQGPAFGTVFWVDTPHSDLDAPLPSDCTPVAQAFDVFIESLGPIP
jgi:hypothetical protein